MNTDMSTQTTAATVEIMVNRSYGGFMLSDEAKALYKQRGGQCTDMDKIARDDPLMVSIVRELGHRRASGYLGYVCLMPIPAQYARHFAMHEYDGLESIVIKYNSYRVAQAKAALQDETLSPEERIARATAALEERFEGEEEQENSTD